MGWFRQHRIAVVVGAALFFAGLIIGVTSKVESTLTETVRKFVTTISYRTDSVNRTGTVERPPSSSGVKISYGEWPGLFRISGSRVINDFAHDGTVLGQFTYLGGADCKLDSVVVEATFFGRRDQVIGTGSWLTNTVPANVGLPMQISGSTQGPAARAEIVVTDASCE